MLQQTQVTTVIGYFERFMQRFPHPRALAQASLDEVLHLWSGLGYYARARNLHRAAQHIRDAGGRFPKDFDALERLPGIGRSTAGAILALSRGERYPILDGNVKRVLARYFALSGDPGSRVMIDALWERSERCTPHRNVAIYTQAIMDLGATVCTRRRPRCAACPLEARCQARQNGQQHIIPAPRTVRSRPTRHTYLLVAVRDDGSVLLERRPQHGIWGGLWCLPEVKSVAQARTFLGRCVGPVKGRPVRRKSGVLAEIHHAFTHFQLTITPLYVDCGQSTFVKDGTDRVWYDPCEPAPLGLPAPVRELLERLSGSEAELPSLPREPARTASSATMTARRGRMQT